MVRQIVLTGFMGSGKSTVGPLLAERLGWKFVDADDVIAAEAGCTIPEIFRREGEAAFRERERATIERLVEGGGLVLALGGGAIETGCDAGVADKRGRQAAGAPGSGVGDDTDALRRDRGRAADSCGQGEPG